MAVNPTEVQLSEAQREYVADCAERTGVPWPEILQELVPANKMQAKKQISAYDLAKQLGFIGMSDGGPTDLATNPIHLEGFGNDGLGSDYAETGAS